MGAGLECRIAMVWTHTAPDARPSARPSWSAWRSPLATPSPAVRGKLVFNAPLDVILSHEDVVQPDLVVTERPQISPRGIESAPLVLVEILSPSRPDYDRLTKARRYAARGVPHYWIVDPEQRTVECFRLEGGAYRLDASGRDREEIVVAAFEGLTLQLEDLWLDD
jgi:Uma2 family endonuclease